MEIKERSRYLIVDPDHSPEPEDKMIKRSKTEAFRDGQIEFTDGFYSSSSDNNADFHFSGKIEKEAHEKAINNEA